MNCVDSFITLITELGLVLLIDNLKLKQVVKLTTEIVS